MPISLKILSNSQAFVTQAPFVNFSQSEKFVTIPYISGLTGSTKYEISLLVI
jgi:hypothetical protein